MRLLRLALLLFAASAIAVEAAASAEPQGSEHGVTWLLQLSDLHISAHSYPERCAASLAAKEGPR